MAFRRDSRADLPAKPPDSVTNYSPFLPAFYPVLGGFSLFAYRPGLSYQFGKTGIISQLPPDVFYCFLYFRKLLFIFAEKRHGVDICLYHKYVLYLW